MPSNTKINNIFMMCKTQLAWVASRIVPPHEIEDIVQETYVRVCQFKTKGEIREPRALMMKTARNIALDYIKKAEVRLSSSLFDEEELKDRQFSNKTANPFDQAASDQEFSQFCEIVRQLPQQCKKVFVLKKVYGYSQREISRELSISESTVEKHIARGMKHCARQMLEDSSNLSSNTGKQSRQFRAEQGEQS
jgi:RNA polymerase sigma-70 factor (ECF subfamily)